MSLPPASSSPRLWDISPPVHAGAPVFPGDTPYQQKWAASIGPGCPVNVSEITLSPHVGAHADAPLHYAENGASIGDTDLTPFLGPCRVIHAIGCGPLIEWAHIAHAIDDTLPARVLVRTYERMPVDRWDPQLAAYAPATVEALAARGVRLIGIDTASIDPADSKTLDSHMTIRRHDMRVLENLVLDAVDEG
ncbi:MAG: arylformamidase, partial [Comamonadaceae bacterium]